MLDLVGNPEDRFSHNEAHITLFQCTTVEKNGFEIVVMIVSSKDIHSEIGSEKGRLFIEKFNLMKEFLSFCQGKIIIALA